MDKHQTENPAGKAILHFKAVGLLDPFCGRGNGPFTATVLGRPALGIDVNPIAWLFATAKLQPAATAEEVTNRLS